jgi:hypothetical protein
MSDRHIQGISETPQKTPLSLISILVNQKFPLLAGTRKYILLFKHFFISFNVLEIYDGCISHLKLLLPWKPEV